VGLRSSFRRIADTTVSRGEQSFTLTSPQNAPRYNFLVGSNFSNVTFTVSLTDPNGNAMPVPEPAREMRVIYCPTRAGEYKLTVTPSTQDHFAHASLDCRATAGRACGANASFEGSERGASKRSDSGA